MARVVCWRVRATILQLTAADYRLTRKGKDDVGLSDKNLERAFLEEIDEQRKARLDVVWQQIEKLSVDRDIETVNLKARRMAARYFKDPALGLAGVQKVIWQ